MNRLLALTTLTSILLSSQANAWEHRRHHHHGDADAAVALIGGLVLGAALADSSNRSSSYSSTTYYSDYPSRYSSRTTYYSEPYYSRPYYTERVYVTEPVTRTTTYYGPVTHYKYPKRKPVERVYYDETLRDEYGNCFSVKYRHGEKVLKSIPRYHCRPD